VWVRAVSKITFRADDDLVAELEAFDASKSEVMREALREYLADRSPEPSDDESADAADSLDAMVEARVDEIVTERVDDVLAERLSDGPPVGYAPPSRGAQDVNVTVNVEGAESTASDATGETERKTEPANDDPASDGSGGAVEDGRDDPTCAQCGEDVDGDHVYCPNCGEKTTRRVFCDCGDEIRSDWGFCPSCGRRTPAADVLDTRNGGS